MSPQEPMAGLLRHLEQAPGYPIPEPLRLSLLGWLRRSRSHRDRLLNELADHIDPRAEMGRWGRAQEVARQVQRYMRPENRVRSGRRPPANRVEELLLEADSCGGALPTSPRRVWDALDEGLSKNTG